MALQVGELARHIATNVSVGERVIFSGGELRRKETGELISADPRLNIGTDMGEIMVRTPLATPKGMQCFLKEVYPYPEKWGIHISDRFTDEQRTHIQTQIGFLNNRLGIEPDNSLSLSVVPRTFKSAFLHCIPNLPFVAYANIVLISFICNDYNPDFISSLFNTGLFTLEAASADLLILLYLFGAYGQFYQRYQFHIPNPFLEAGTFDFVKSRIEDMIPSHEYVHFLRDCGAIKNDIISDSVRCLMQLEINGKLASDCDGDFAKGLAADPYKLITGRRMKYLWECPKSYATGKQVGGVAAQLADRLADHEARWEFIRIVGNSNQEELLPNLLDSRFAQFFDRPEG